MPCDKLSKPEWAGPSPRSRISDWSARRAEEETLAKAEVAEAAEAAEAVAHQDDEVDTADLTANPAFIDLNQE